MAEYLRTLLYRNLKIGAETALQQQVHQNVRTRLWTEDKERALKKISYHIPGTWYTRYTNVLMVIFVRSYNHSRIVRIVRRHQRINRNITQPHIYRFSTNTQIDLEQQCNLLFQIRWSWARTPCTINIILYWGVATSQVHLYTKGATHRLSVASFGRYCWKFTRLGTKVYYRRPEGETLRNMCQLSCSLTRQNGAHLVAVDGLRLFRYSGVGTATDLQLVVPTGFDVFDDLWYTTW